MAAAANLDWLYHLLGWTLAAAGLLLLLWALFWDRSRGRKRCPKCWYSMEGVPGLKCPECGREAKSERKLLKTRRRWLAIVPVCMLALASYSTYAIPIALRQGWRAAIPSSVLVFVAPLGDQSWTWTEAGMGIPKFGAPKDKLLMELLRRCDGRDLRAWQYQIVFDRYFKANPDQTGRLLRARDRWPRGVPIHVEPLLPLFVGRNWEDTILRLRIRGSADPWIEWPLSEAYLRLAFERSADLPATKSPAVDVEAELLIGSTVTKQGWRLTRVDASTARPIWRGILKHITTVESASNIMQPLNGNADFAVLGLNPRLERASDGRVYLALDRSGSHLDGGHEDWALGMYCEVLRGDTLIGTGSIVYPVVEPGTLVDYVDSSPIQFYLRWADPPIPADDSSAVLRLRLTGDSRVAIRDLNRTVFWSGQIQVPLKGIQPAARPRWPRLAE